MIRWSGTGPAPGCCRTATAPSSSRSRERTPWPASAARSRRRRCPGQCELVPAARTVLVVLDRPPTDLDVAVLRRLPAPSTRSRRAPPRR